MGAVRGASVSFEIRVLHLDGLLVDVSSEPVLIVSL